MCCIHFAKWAVEWHRCPPCRACTRANTDAPVSPLTPPFHLLIPVLDFISRTVLCSCQLRSGTGQASLA